MVPPESRHNERDNVRTQVSRYTRQRGLALSGCIHRNSETVTLKRSSAAFTGAAVTPLGGVPHSVQPPLRAPPSPEQSGLRHPRDLAVAPIWSTLSRFLCLSSYP